jgi:hypothetical protein
MIHNHLSSEAATIDQSVADVPSGLGLTPPHPHENWKRKGMRERQLPEVNHDYNEFSEKAFLQFLTLTLGKDEWSAVRSGRFTIWDRALCTHG